MVKNEILVFYIAVSETQPVRNCEIYKSQKWFVKIRTMSWNPLWGAGGLEMVREGTNLELEPPLWGLEMVREEPWPGSHCGRGGIIRIEYIDIKKIIMIKENIEQLIARDLEKLKLEIEAYEDELLIWQTIKGINNSAGNLCLHLVGNLNTYIGSILGKTGYVRNREQEFSIKNIPKATLVEEINNVKTIIEKTFVSLTDDMLAENYPDEVLGTAMSTRQFLIHLISHLNYHLGQINYHRRILTAIKKPL